MHSLRMNIGDYITAKTFPSDGEQVFEVLPKVASIVDLSENIFRINDFARSVIFYGLSMNKWSLRIAKWLMKFSDDSATLIL